MAGRIKLQLSGGGPPRWLLLPKDWEELKRQTLARLELAGADDDAVLSSLRYFCEGALIDSMALIQGGDLLTVEVDMASVDVAAEKLHQQAAAVAAAYSPSSSPAPYPDADTDTGITAQQQQAHQQVVQIQSPVASSSSSSSGSSSGGCHGAGGYVVGDHGGHRQEVHCGGAGGGALSGCGGDDGVSMNSERPEEERPQEMAPPKQAEYRLVNASYKADKGDGMQLTVKKGDAVQVFLRDPSGWTYGELSNGNCGWFPDRCLGKRLTGHEFHSSLNAQQQPQTTTTSTYPYPHEHHNHQQQPTPSESLGQGRYTPQHHAQNHYTHGQQQQQQQQSGVVHSTLNPRAKPWHPFQGPSFSDILMRGGGHGHGGHGGGGGGGRGGSGVGSTGSGHEDKTPCVQAGQGDGGKGRSLLRMLHQQADASSDEAPPPPSPLLSLSDGQEGGGSPVSLSASHNGRNINSNSNSNPRGGSPPNGGLSSKFFCRRCRVKEADLGERLIVMDYKKQQHSSPQQQQQQQPCPFSHDAHPFPFSHEMICRSYVKRTNNTQGDGEHDDQAMLLREAGGHRGRSWVQVAQQGGGPKKVSFAVKQPGGNGGKSSKDDRDSRGGGRSMVTPTLPSPLKSSTRPRAPPPISYSACITKTNSGPHTPQLSESALPVTEAKGHTLAPTSPTRAEPTPPLSEGSSAPGSPPGEEKGEE
ncbi:unnamed protein product [Vitrella brassicaformis CCMP3155]|uniref:SH3 domain-containing protein n=2 Tax=Vitrella brassicaformis TaxID=1169539 RepID=A0A0G4F3V2_VITBC|nr:unnamed protein product [Vitrella brassicaformis CCMP3155]|eukprot:CEM06515.1 unnamed protein product [Vitrella brassicaformis CCMP3155]